jgi:hypothetical protein
MIITMTEGCQNLNFKLCYAGPVYFMAFELRRVSLDVDRGSGVFLRSSSTYEHGSRGILRGVFHLIRPRNRPAIMGVTRTGISSHVIRVRKSLLYVSNVEPIRHCIFFEI